jgi:DNA-binding NtrC family response regulator
MSEKKTILVVDDEADVRKLVGNLLIQFGYSAITADSGDNAMALYKKHNAPIDLLITDVVSPGMSGPMLADRLTELQPGLKVLYISGYDNTNVVRKFVIEKHHELLTKPFTAKQLEAKLAQMLQPAPAGPAAG